MSEQQPSECSAAAPARMRRAQAVPDACKGFCARTTCRTGTRRQGGPRARAPVRPPARAPSAAGRRGALLPRPQGAPQRAARRAGAPQCAPSRGTACARMHEKTLPAYLQPLRVSTTLSARCSRRALMQTLWYSLRACPPPLFCMVQPHGVLDLISSSLPLTQADAWT
jgi:hypothetical protein